MRRRPLPVLLTVEKGDGEIGRLSVGSEGMCRDGDFADQRAVNSWPPPYTRHITYTHTLSLCLYPPGIESALASAANGRGVHTQRYITHHWAYLAVPMMTWIARKSKACERAWDWSNCLLGKLARQWVKVYEPLVIGSTSTSEEVFSKSLILSFS